jgi:sporulation protein YlmC with PRC-barrel domain
MRSELPHALAALAVGAAVVVTDPLPALTQAIQLVVVDVATVGRGYRVSKLEGKAVYNEQNQQVGSLDDIILGPDKRAIFAVVQVGGFLGMGGHMVAVPFDSLNIDGSDGKIVLPGATKDELKRLPEFKYT